MKTNTAYENRKARIENRLARANQPDGAKPVLAGGNLAYEVSDRIQAVAAGGLGMVQAVIDAVGVGELLDEKLSILKQPKPYHDRDHVLSLALNLLSGGQTLADLRSRRWDEGYLNALGAQRIPDPTTSGDYLRRFKASDLEDFLGVLNAASARVWRSRPAAERGLATLDVDGTITTTEGECKERMDISYDGQWGFHPLVLSLANSQEVISIVNRPANVVSHEGAAPRLDRAISWALEDARFAKVRLRGDTDFSLTENFDKWTDRGVEFVFGIDAHRSFVRKVKELPVDSWAPLARPERPARQRRSPASVKDEVTERRGFRKLTLEEEHVAEMPYCPTKSKKGEDAYRMIVVRKRLHVTEGQMELEDEIRYRFYVTNVEAQELPTTEVVFQNNQRCHQENLIEQLKNGVRATRLPSHDFNANWAYMIVGALAWNIKAWCAQLLPRDPGTSRVILKMEFRAFLHELVMLPAQILCRGRRIIFRFLAVNDWIPLILEGTRRLQCLHLP